MAKILRFFSFGTLERLFAKLQNNRKLPDSENITENISRYIQPGDPGYEYNFTKHLVYYLYAGHTLLNDIRLRDRNEDDV